jgi:hypothetical protein
MESASMTAIAFHDPKQLSQVEHRLRRKHGLLPSRATVMAKAAALLKDAARPTVGA